MSFKIAPNGLALNNIGIYSGSLASTSINVAYVHNTSGAAVAFRVNARDLNSVTDAGIFISGYTGTTANVTMRCRIYDENTGVSTRPGTNLKATSSTTTLPASVGWARFQFASPYSPTNIGEVFWVVFDNTAAAPATDFPLVRTTIATALFTQSFFAPHSTTNGFSAAVNRLIQMPGWIIQGGATRGNTQTTSSTPVVANTRPRGLVLTPPADCTIEVMEFNSAPGVSIANIKIWDSSQLPNGTPIYSFATGGTGRASSEISGTISFEPPFVARRNKTYYVCFDFASTNTSPACMTTEDYTTYSSIFDQNVDNFTLMPLVRDNGSNAWVIDNANSPRIQLIIGDLPSQTLTTGY
jgi:hypothetical protein